MTTAASESNVAGTMAALNCSKEMVDRLLQQVAGYVVVANINSPKQTVISGELSSVEELIKLATADGIQARQLSVSNAFHSELVSAAADEMCSIALNYDIFVNTDVLTNPSVHLFSSFKGGKVRRGLYLSEYFASQIFAEVDFVSLVEAIARECDLMVEVGPGNVLSSLWSANTDLNDPLCFPLESSKKSIERELNTFLGSFFVHGGEINWESLYENRLLRPFVPASQRRFIENPLERPFNIAAGTYSKVIEDQSQLKLNKTEDMVELLSNYLSQRGQFLADVIRADIQNLPSLLTTNKDFQNQSSVSTLNDVITAEVRPVVEHKHKTDDPESDT
jgi:acyl transferase domain-containing protein